MYNRCVTVLFVFVPRGTRRLAGVDDAPTGIKGLNQYSFNGKERQNELILSGLDYGTRFYDPARWVMC